MSTMSTWDDGLHQAGGWVSVGYSLGRVSLGYSTGTYLGT